MISENRHNSQLNMPEESSPFIPPGERPKRRVRYQGTHPRRFAEKYKEHNLDRYSADVARVVASGKTPAGTHLPILVEEILSWLDPRPGQIVADCTLGYGGHARELLKRILPGGRLIGLDVDPIELPKTEARLRRMTDSPDTLRIHRSNFAGLPQILARDEIEGVDAILADLGVSSMQIDDPVRGFTFKADGPLDLRMNPERGQPASAFLASLDLVKLADLLRENSDEPRADRIAEAILKRNESTPLRTTKALAGCIRAALPGVRKDDADTTIRRVFQALRIAVNDEFDALETFLRNLPACLKSGGKVAILTFHSGEDRRVKKFFEAGRGRGDYSGIADEVIRPGPAELRGNPRSSPAKLRWAVRA